jgi:hypothetical protein
MIPGSERPALFLLLVIGTLASETGPRVASPGALPDFQTRGTAPVTAPELRLSGHAGARNR